MDASTARRRIPHSNRRVLLSIFLFFLLFYGYFYNGGGGNPTTRLNLTRAIVARGTLYVDRIGFPSDDQLYINGHVYTSKAPGTSLLGVPAWALFHGIERLLGLRSPFFRNFVVHLTTVVTVGIPAALAMVALYLFLVSLGIGPPRAFFATASVGVGTTFFPYATMYFGHSLAGSLAFLAFYLLRRASVLRGEGEDPGRRVLWAALLVSAAVVTEYPVGIVAVLLTAYLLWTRPSGREVLYWIAGGAVGVAVLALYNTFAFGNPLALSYLEYAHSAHNTFPQHSKGLAGVTWPKWRILKKILWSDERGIIWFSPVVVLAVPGLVALTARRRGLYKEAAIIMVMMAGYLAFNAGYGDSIRYWGGANSAGPRHLIPTFPFLGLAIGALFAVLPLGRLGDRTRRLAGKLRARVPAADTSVSGRSLIQGAAGAWVGFTTLLSWAAVWLAAHSMATCLAITAVMPQVPMLYPKPLEQFIFPYFLQGRLSLHRGGIISRDLVTHDSIAYNLGKVAGIPGSWSLVPLYLMAVAVVFVLLFRLVESNALFRADAYLGVCGVLAGAVGLLAGSLVYQHAHARPLDGPGVFAVYYYGDKCGGDPVWVTREDDLSFRFLGKEIRPHPSKFCAKWRAYLDVPVSGDYVFGLAGAQARLTIDGVDVVELPRKQRRARGTVTLEAGAHELEVEAVMTILNNRFDVLWRPPGARTLRKIPADRLSTPGY